MKKIYTINVIILILIPIAWFTLLSKTQISFKNSEIDFYFTCCLIALQSLINLTIGLVHKRNKNKLSKYYFTIATFLFKAAVLFPFVIIFFGMIAMYTLA